jgi:UDP-N-acetylglucosamine--N-acetylmuramyl-(pentapeptide) pyrophosphoryl-undecaprenol N-acetylglucosamine transferase
VADHQTSNAQALADAGAAVLVKDAELDGERLTREVSALLANPQRLDAMRAASRELGQPDAARRVAELLLTTARRPSSRTASPLDEPRASGAR